MTLTPRHIDRSPDEQTWNALIESIIKTIKTLDEWHTPPGQSDIKTWSVRNGADTLRLDEFKRKSESMNLRNRVHIGNDAATPKTHQNTIQDTTMTLFFSPITGSIDEMRMSTELGTVSFDNGIWSGPERKSFHFKLHVRQEFSLDGRPKLLDISRPNKWNVELYIEAQIYEGCGVSEALNSFSYYNIQDGKLFPLSDAIADLTRNHVDLVHEIIETRTINQASQVNLNTPFPVESGDSMREHDLITQSQKSKPEYTIRVHEETLEVLFHGNSIGEVRVLPFLNPAEHVSKFLSSYQDATKGIMG